MFCFVKCIFSSVFVQQKKNNIKRRHTTQHKIYLNHINIHGNTVVLLYYLLVGFLYGKCSIECTQRCQYLFKKFTMLPERYNDMLNNLLFNVIMVN